MNSLQRRRIFRWSMALLVLLFLGFTGCADDTDLDGGDATNQSDRDAGGTDANNSNGGSDADTNGDDDADADRPDPDDSGDQNDWDWDDEDFGINAVIPARGPLSGGTEVQVTGESLSAGTRLLFDNRETEVTLSQGQLVATTPAADGYGPVTVRAISADGEVSEIPNGFTYVDEIAVDDITPQKIPTTGGTEVTLTGQGFTSPMGVSFSGTAASRVDVVDDNTAHITTPPMDRGWSDLRVTVPDAQAEIEEAIQFFDPLDVDTVDPAIGDPAGGDAITISGEGFTPDLSVTFDDVAADVQAVDVGAQTVTVIAPAAATTGYVDLVLENEFDAHRARDAYYYDTDEDDKLVTIAPDTAPISGATEHLVSGRGLNDGNTEIFVGDNQATIIDSGDDFALIEVPAATDADTVDVVFSRDGTEIDRLVDGLTYLPELTIDDISPSSGSADGGDTVEITGSGFEDVTKVTFAGLSAGFEIDGDGQLTVTTPAANAGWADVTIETDSQETAVDDAYYFEGPVEIWSMTPSRGALAGNTLVTLHGQGFDGEIGVTVGDEAASSVRRIDPYTVTFRTPRATATGPADVEMEAQEQQAQPPYPFVYFNPANSFGGAWGPPVQGSVNVSVLTEAGTPIPNAYVTMSIHADTEFRGYTNDAGQVTISGPGLAGPQTVTATAADMSTVTVREINAQNLTVILNPIEPPEGDGGGGNPPPMAMIDGEVTITGKGADPEGGAEYNMSTVEVTRNSMLGGHLSPGEDSIVAGEGGFEVRSRVGDVALVALCGYYDADTEIFTPRLMGVERYLTLANGEEKTVDIECDIPLEESLSVRLVDSVYAPSGPNTNRIWPYLDFGFEGFFRMPEPVTGLEDVLVADGMPAPEGILEDVTYAVVAGSYMGNGGIPYSQVTARGFEDPSRLHSTPPLVGVTDLIDPAPGGTIGDAISLGLKGQNAPDMHYIVLRNSYGLPVWTFIAPGHEDYIPMPEFPAFADLPSDARPDPYQTGTFYSLAYGIGIDDFDYNTFTYNDLATAAWSGFSVDTWTLQLVEGL